MAINEDIRVVGVAFGKTNWRSVGNFGHFGRTVTESDVVSFIGMTGMLELLFTNVEHLINQHAEAVMVCSPTRMMKREVT